MDTISFKLRRVERSEELKLDGISFPRCAFVHAIINGSFDSLNEFPDSLVVFSELERSLSGSGRYLIFTCACGVADDGGWDYVNVSHHGPTIGWSFSRDQDYSFVFQKDLYRASVRHCADQIASLDAGMHLEPSSFVYPEENNQGEQAATVNR
jgi:hypothetical protein